MKRFVAILAGIFAILFSCEACASGRLSLHGHGPARVTFSFTMGANTLTGMGDYPVDGTFVSEVDKNGNARTDIVCCSGGVATAASTWAANSTARAPYTLVTTTGTYTITAPASTYSVGKQADWGAASGGTGVGALPQATLAGKTISMRSGLSIASWVTGNTGTPLRRSNYGTGSTGLTITSDDITNPATFTDNLNITSRYLVFRGIAFTIAPNDPLRGAFIIASTASVPVSDIWIDQCTFIGPYKDPNGNYSGGQAAFGNGDAIKSNGVNNFSNLRITGSTFLYTRRAVQIRSLPALAGAGNMIPESLTMSGNRVDVFYMLGLQGLGGDGGGVITIADNVISRPAGKVSDTGAPHTDALSVFGQGSAVADQEVAIYRNFVFQGSARGQSASVALRDFVQAGVDSGHFFTGSIIGNVVSMTSSEGMAVQNAKNLTVLNNTVLARVGDTGTSQINIATGADSTTSGTHTIQKNITETLAYGGLGTNVADNVLTTTGGYTYAQVLVGPTFAPNTRAEMLTLLIPNPAGPAILPGIDAGAVGSGAANFPAANPSDTAGTNNVP